MQNFKTFETQLMIVEISWSSVASRYWTFNNNFLSLEQNFAYSVV